MRPLAPSTGSGAGGWRQAVAFLTPLGGAARPTPAALAWFPVVGAALGLALGGLWRASAELWPAVVAAALMVAADLALTGLLHLDGLADSADGLLPHLPRERRLAVMAEPATGAFGTGTAIAVLLLRWAALAALAPSAWLLAGLWCASRTAMALAATALPYARPDGGLATAFLGGARRLPWLGLPLSAGLVVAWSAVPGAAALAGLAVGAGAVLALARHRLGGFTGDVLGAAGLVGETVGLVVAAARW